MALAVAGCGYWGRNLVRVAHGLGALAAVCDRDPEAARAQGEAHGVPARGWDDLLADPAIDAVVIATPAAAHAAMADAALAAGKHVFVEKPLALDLDAARALVARAQAAGRVLMVGHLLQYHPAFVALRGLVAEGALGRISYVASSRLNFGKVRREESALWSFAPHDISMILALTGEQPESVACSGANVLHRRIADVTTTHLTFASGAGAHIHVSWLNPVKEQRLTVVGEKAMAVFDDGQDWPRKLTIYRHRVDWHEGRPELVKAEAEPVALEAAEPLALELGHFLVCAATGARPRTDGEEGVRVLAVLQAAERSLGAAGAPQTLAAPPPAPGYYVHPSAFVDPPCEIGAGTKIWHFSHVLKNCRIGRDCIVGQNAAIGPDVTIGDRCKIQNNVSLYRGVTLEDGVFCGPSAVFTNVLTPRAEVERKNEFLPTLVRRGATVGANATVLCGVTLGAYCLVAAGAVVTADVADYALVAGVPARRVGWVSRTGERLGPDLVCPRTGERYREAGPDRLEPA